MTQEMEDSRRRELQDILQKNVELLLVLNKSPKDGDGAEGTGEASAGDASGASERTKVNTNVHMPASSKGKMCIDPDGVVVTNAEWSVDLGEDEEGEGAGDKGRRAYAEGPRGGYGGARELNKHLTSHTITE